MRRISRRRYNSAHHSRVHALRDNAIHLSQSPHSLPEDHSSMEHTQQAGPMIPPAPAKRRSLPARAENLFWRILVRVAPKTRRGDYVVSLLRFLRMQRRWPRRERRWFNDQLFAIKTSDEILDPLRVFTSDKELVRLYVKATVGDAHNVPTLAVLRSLEECRNFAFPNRCVIKPTHLSGTVILRRHGEPIDWPKIEHWFRHNNYPASREANYRQLRPKVVVEPFVFDDDNARDYKFFCSNGRPTLIQVDNDRFRGHTRNFYDPQWSRLDLHMTYPPGDVDDPRPDNLEEMLELAQRLSRDFSFVRVDLYSDGKQALLGELTHCHGSAGEYFVPRSAEAAASRIIFGG